MTARDGLAGALAPDLLAALEEYVGERIAEALADHAPSNGDGPRWLTTAQAAERLGCSTDAARMRVNRGRLRARHEGSRLYVLAADVDPGPATTLTGLWPSDPPERTWNSVAMRRLAGTESILTPGDAPTPPVEQQLQQASSADEDPQSPQDAARG